jgi:hypothetical protein
MLTTILPMSIGSPTGDLQSEQIALISQFKPEHRRKLWVLRMPAAYIMQRTCDMGAQNWVGQDDYIQVSQRYGLGLILSDDHAVPVTRATDSQRQSGISVFVQITNSVIDPDRLHQTYATRASIHGFVVGHNDQPSCAEQPSAIPGLITFKRINPDVDSSLDCEGILHTLSVFARKVGDRSDVVIECWARCMMYGDYEGWAMEYLLDREHLERCRPCLIRSRDLWQIIPSISITIDRVPATNEVGFGSGPTKLGMSTTSPLSP